jgi:HJR/Mrr/RecB family endonuclease
MKRVFLSGPYGSQDDLGVLADALRAEGIEVWRPDQMRSGFTFNSTEEILSAIKQCDVFVALLSKPHPNVMFELGYALAASKAVLLIRGPGGEIPFELASFPFLMIDRLDPRSVADVVNRVRQASVKSQPQVPTFTNSHDKLRHMCEDEAFLDSIESRAFEQCVADVLREKGFDAQLLPERNEKGFDVELNEFLPNTRAVVEVKKQNRNGRLSVTEVQRIVGAAVLARATQAMMITSGGFTATAKYFAANSPIQVNLLTIDQLLELSRDDLTKRRDFVGRWRILAEGTEREFVIILSASGEAIRFQNNAHALGKWEVVGTEARITWDDRKWKDILRPVESKVRKLAFSEGKSWNDQPSNEQWAERIPN